MLPKKHRLTEKKDFKRVMERGRSFFIRDCGIKVLQRKNAESPTRIGIVVPKKLTKTIVKRNRIKRQVRHIFIDLLPEIPSNLDIVFLSRPGFINLESEEMKKLITSLIKKAAQVYKT